METMYIISLRDIDTDYYHYIYTGILPKQYKQAYEKITTALGLDIEFQGTYVDEVDKVYISHGMQTVYEYELFGYRRLQIRDYIKSHYTDYVIAADDIVEPQYIICSEPRVGILELIEKEYLKDKVKFIYDKTDNWGALNNFAYKIDGLCMQYADVVTYSAIGLLNQQYKAKSYYVPNGNIWYNIDTQDKYETPTAIYAGNNIEKLHGALLYKLACLYPNWNFIVYVNREQESEPAMMNHPSNVEFRMPIPQEQLIKEMSKCHAGLLLFYNNDWCSGMLPLKLFNYLNAKLPILYTSGLYDNLQDYRDVTFCINDTILDDLLDVTIDEDKYKRTWDDVLQELSQCWRIPHEIK